MMPGRTKQIDAYINKAAPFAKPILRKVRDLFHRGCPQLTETLKWNVPHFEHKGVLGGIAAFKAHIRLGFWKHKLINENLALPKGKGCPSMGGTLITSLDQLPDDKTFVACVREAMRLNEQGKSVPRPPLKKIPAKAITPPPDFLAAMKKNKKALATFDAFSPSPRKEYIEWITDAKQPETRARRIATAVKWIAQGKRRNWKYEK
jgi:hypothetical protein